MKSASLRRRLCFGVVAGLVGIVTFAAPAQAVTTSWGEPCTIVGDDGDNILRGSNRRDVICGGGGNDRIFALGGHDVIDAGPGNDSVFAGAGNDFIVAGAGLDVINAGAGLNSCDVEDGESLGKTCKTVSNLDRLATCDATIGALPEVTPEMVEPTTRQFVNGTSVIRVPNWVVDPLGEYYMYFADHKGKYIRLAYADEPQGPWTVVSGGVLNVINVLPVQNHIASPDIYIDNTAHTIYLAAHIGGTGLQTSILAESSTGLAFQQRGGIAPPPFIDFPYVRLFDYGGDVYAFVPSEIDMTTAQIFRANSITDPFTLYATIETNREIRHVAVTRTGDTLTVYYTAVGETPERIQRATMDLTRPPAEWSLSAPECIRAPSETWEGSIYPFTASERGPALKVRQLRDPFVLVDEAGTFLYYSYAGESGIASAELIR